MFNCSLVLQLPRRFHTGESGGGYGGGGYGGGGGGAGGWKTSTQYEYTDAAGAGTSGTQSDSFRSTRGSRKGMWRCGLILLLILGALLLAFGVGLLVYYLLHSCRFILSHYCGCEYSSQMSFPPELCVIVFSLYVLFLLSTIWYFNTKNYLLFDCKVL